MSETEAAAFDPTNTVVVDAMGGDNAPDVVLEGCAMALARDSELKVILAGPEDVVVPFCEAHDRAEALVAPEVIGMGEHPTKAVRAKRDSSIVKGCKAVKEGRAGGFYSAGSTGACLAAATLFIGRIKGVARPALATMLPGGTIMADVGANADCKPEYLVQFAQMASAYCTKTQGTERPTVALLNIGAEETKGSAAAQEAYALMSAGVEGFAGNAEGSDLLAGRFNVVVTDGFTGNVALKTAEGTAKALLKSLKGIFYSSLATKLAAATMKGKLAELAASMGSEATGAAPLLGVAGVAYVGHGSSTAAEVRTGIEGTVRAARNGLVDAIAASVAPASSDGVQ